MTRLTAIVRNGRLVLDEPTSLPEGTRIELAVLDEAPPESSAYEPVSLRELELVENAIAPSERTQVSAPVTTERSPGAPSREDSLLSISPRAPARSVIARRHLTTLSEKRLARAEGTPLAAQVREAAMRAITHLRQLEVAPEGENYLTHAKEALEAARHALSLVQTAANSDPELIPAVEEAGEAVGMIFSLLS